MKKLFLLIFICPLLTYSSLVMQPYLQALSSNSAYVCVECTVADTVTINYGTTVSFGSNARTSIISTTGGSTYVHKILLNNLTANTLYYYRAVQGSSVSSTFSFHSAVLPGTGFRFAVMGDCRTDVTTHGQIATDIIGRNPLMSVYSGDMCYDDNYTTWKSEYFITQELNLISQVPFFLAPGNHEAWGPNNQAFVCNPTSSSGTQAYYSFDIGDVHFVSINMYVDYSVNGTQYNWVNSDLASTNKRWKVVFFHEPAYAYGGHGSNTVMQTWTTNIFLPRGVDMVICGHNHFYQHCLANGLHHFVIGGGGAPLYVPSAGQYVVMSAQSFCYGIFDVTLTSIHMNIYSNTNSFIDSLTWNKPVGIKKESDEVISSYKLYQNYPNPFNPTTKIKFDVPEKNTTNVSLSIYDISGKSVATLVNEKLNGGTYEVSFDGSNLSSGTYFCKLIAGSYSNVKKIILAK